MSKMNLRFKKNLLDNIVIRLFLAVSPATTELEGGLDFKTIDKIFETKEVLNVPF